MPTPRASKGRSGWLNTEITRIGQLVASIKITGIRRWERLGIGFFYTDAGQVVPEFNMDHIRELIHAPFRVVYLRQAKEVVLIRIWQS